MSSGRDADANFQEAVRRHQLGDVARAATLYRKVLARAPAHADALQLLGLLEAQDGKLASAADLLARSVKIQPGNAATWINFGNVLLGLQQPTQALAAYDRAIAIQQPGYAAYLNRGNALRDLGRPEEALASYDEALRLEPDSADAFCNRGNALRDLGRPADAVDCYDRALALNSAHADALCNRGAALKDLGRLEEAGRDCERALALRPDHAVALNNLADVLSALGRHADAAAVFDRLSEMFPGFDYAPGYALHSRLRACDWGGHEAAVKRLVAGVRRRQRVAVPFSFLAVSDSASDQLCCAQVHVAHKFPAAPPPWSGPRYGHERIRLAYLSADFHDHATARLTAGLFEQHDRSRFEVIGISYGLQRQDAMRARLERAFDRFVDVSSTVDREVAGLLREAEIDIAIDLKGYTQDARPGILAARAAPSQVSYLGFPGTLGAPFVDYLIADRHLIREGEAAHYAEKLVYLPDSYQANDAAREIAPTVQDRTAAGLPPRGFVFCCFNASYKIVPAMFDVWMRLLRDLDGSVLWLFEDNADAVRNLRREAARRGVAAERLVFAPRAAPSEHLARHALADLFLDTLPYGAHTTASDALWAGLPVLTCTGTTFAGRVATSLLHAIGMPELIAADLALYEAKARALAGNPTELAALREKLARNRLTHPLFDTARFARNLEAAYVSIWEQEQAR